MGRTALSETEIQHRLTDGRNYRRLYNELKDKYDAVVAKNKQLLQTIATQATRIDELQAEVKRLTEQVDNLTDSKTRYRFYLFGGPGGKGKPKGKGRQGTNRDPASYTRPKPSEDEVTDRQELTLTFCPHCQGPVSGSVDSFTKCVEDIVFAPKTVTEYTVNRHWCTNCRKIVRPAIPDCLPGMSLGLNTVLFVLTEHYRAKKTDEQIVESLERYFNLTMSLGEVSQIRHLAASYFGDKYDAIVESIRTADVIYADESGWHIQGVKQHAEVWHVNAPEVPAALYHMAETRGKDEIQDLLAAKDGRQFPDVIVSDFYAAYDGLSAEQQKCWAHLLRDSHLLVQSQPDSQERIDLHKRLTGIFREISKFQRSDDNGDSANDSSHSSTGHEHEHVHVHWDKARAGPLEARLDKRLKRLATHSWSDSQCQRLAKRLAKYHHQLLTCIRLPNVLPENNTAERGLRPVVVQRKITGGSRSRKGADTYGVNKTVIETLWLEGGDLGAPPKQPIKPAQSKLADK